MILSMNSQDLLEGLNTVTRALSPRPAKQILEGVLISAEENRTSKQELRRPRTPAKKKKQEKKPER